MAAAVDEAKAYVAMVSKDVEQKVLYDIGSEMNMISNRYSHTTYKRHDQTNDHVLYK